MSIYKTKYPINSHKSMQLRCRLVVQQEQQSSDSVCCSDFAQQIIDIHALNDNDITFNACQQKYSTHLRVHIHS